MASSGEGVVVFEQKLDVFVEEFVAYAQKKHKLPEAASKRLKQMIDYNCHGGKMSRGLNTLNMTRLLCKERGVDITSAEKQLQLHALSWCMELIQATGLVADDIMDGSTTRRGKACWYTLPEVGYEAVNDAFLLESFVFFLLKKYFSQEKFYSQLFDLHHEVIFETELGQMLDMMSQNKKNFDNFTEEYYSKMVRCKTSMYTFYLPMAAAMIFSGIDKEEAFDCARDISTKLGEKFQVQDDFMDCFADPKVIGKIGTDIQDFKCTWLIVQALLLATEQQRVTLKKLYGNGDEESVSQVKKIYKDLSLPERFAESEHSSFTAITECFPVAEKLGIPSSILESILNTIHLRKK